MKAILLALILLPITAFSQTIANWNFYPLGSEWAPIASIDSTDYSTELFSSAPNISFPHINNAFIYQNTWWTAWYAISLNEAIENDSYIEIALNLSGATSFSEISLLASTGESVKPLTLQLSYSVDSSPFQLTGTATAVNSIDHATPDTLRFNLSSIPNATNQLSLRLYVYGPNTNVVILGNNSNPNANGVSLTGNAVPEASVASLVVVGFVIFAFYQTLRRKYH